MFSHWKNSDDLFTRSYKSLTLGIFYAGSFLIFLATLFFVFPALIGILFAVFILLFGIFTLYLGYKFWRLNSLTPRLCKVETRFSTAYAPWSRSRYQHIFFIER